MFLFGYFARGFDSLQVYHLQIRNYYVEVVMPNIMVRILAVLLTLSPRTKKWSTIALIGTFIGSCIWFNLPVDFKTRVEETVSHAAEFVDSVGITYTP